MPAKVKELHQCLLSVRAYSSEGHELLKNVVQELLGQVELVKLSSVYRVKGILSNNNKIHDLRSVESFEGLTVVLRGQTEKNPQELKQLFELVERNHRSEVMHRSVSLLLLAYEDQTLMTPQLTLPFPEFHLNPEDVIPAAEVWGDFVHPVLKVNIHKLSQPFKGQDWGEFFAQGKSLLT